MKIIVVNGDCIQTNTSANLCHIAYLKGLVDLGHDITLLSADSKGYSIDSSIKIPPSIKHFTYNGISLYERMAIKKHSMDTTLDTDKNNINQSNNNHVNAFKNKILNCLKKTVLNLYGIHGIYIKFVKVAQKFKSTDEYDFVISISTPVTSHLLTHNLLNANHIRARHWIQIWEDPWYNDAYEINRKEKIKEEEERLLSVAEKVCYVSPLTMNKQRELFPESARKMYWQPLPYYYKSQGKVEGKTKIKNNLYGYFGDYVPVSRNLEPFYKAAKKLRIPVNICGNPRNLFVSTDKIIIHPRLSLDELRPIEDSTNVLVFLCNRKGGQIPGKIYQYSATEKMILFILDGTEEEKRVLREYFEKFNRYFFCENTVEDISRAIKDIESGNFGNVVNEPVESFSPKETVRKILAGENG